MDPHSLPGRPKSSSSATKIEDLDTFSLDDIPNHRAAPLDCMANSIQPIGQQVSQEHQQATTSNQINSQDSDEENGVVSSLLKLFTQRHEVTPFVTLLNSNGSQNYLLATNQTNNDIFAGDQSASANYTTLSPVLSRSQAILRGQTMLSTSNSANANESPYRLEALSESWQFYLVILYSLTAITSVILNVITVIVLSRCRRSELGKYLINLSMTDLLMSLFSIPFTYSEYMLGRWVFPSFLCPVVRFVVTLSVFVSAATMTVIGINRHLAIMYPMGRRKCSTFGRWTIRKTHVITAIWLVGIAISTPEYLMFSVEPFCYKNRVFFDCRQHWPGPISERYSVFIFLCTFIIPVSLMSYFYTSIGLKLWRRQMPGNVDVNRDLTMQTQRVKVIKMLFVVVVLFVVSWLPIETFSMICFVFPEIRENFIYQSVEYNIFVGSYFAFHWLSMAHSCVNPLIYCYMNDKFRSHLHDLVCKRNKYTLYAISSKSHQPNKHNYNHSQSISACRRQSHARQTTAVLSLSSPKSTERKIVCHNHRQQAVNKQAAVKLNLAHTGGAGGRAARLVHSLSNYIPDTYPDKAANCTLNNGTSNDVVIDECTIGESLHDHANGAIYLGEKKRQVEEAIFVNILRQNSAKNHDHQPASNSSTFDIRSNIEEEDEEEDESSGDEEKGNDNDDDDDNNNNNTDESNRKDEESRQSVAGIANV